MITWDLPLDCEPRILAASTNSPHGRHGIECYRIPDFWCLNLYRGPVELSIAGTVQRLTAGMASITPPGVDHEYRYARPQSQAWVHFAVGQGISRTRVPLAVHLGHDFERGTQIARDPLPVRARARLWTMLWDLADRVDVAAGDAAAPVVMRAQRCILDQLSVPQTSSAAAQAAGCSLRHLNRLFLAHVGKNVGQWIRAQRVTRAEYLLRHTSRPVAEVAMEVGVPDLQSFNKLIRTHLGAAPRKVRNV